MEIVINKCHGDFRLSYAAKMAYAKKKGIELYAYKWVIGHDGRVLRNEKTGLIIYRSASGEDKSLLGRFLYFTGPRPTKELSGDIELGSDKETNRTSKHFSDTEIERHDKDLVAVVKKFGKESWGLYVELDIVIIPDNVEYEIAEYNGIEHIAEKHRTWH